MIQEDDRELLESDLACPVYFAVAIGRDTKTLKLEKALSAKIPPIVPGAKVGIEFLSEADYPTPLPYAVLELTYVRGEPVRIILDRIEHQFRVRAHWGEAGLVNGFDLRIDNVDGLPLAQARRLPAILEMGRVIRELAESDLWQGYSQSNRPSAEN